MPKRFYIDSEDSKDSEDLYVKIIKILHRRFSTRFKNVQKAYPKILYNSNFPVKNCVVLTIDYKLSAYIIDDFRLVKMYTKQNTKYKILNNWIRPFYIFLSDQSWLY